MPRLLAARRAALKALLGAITARAHQGGPELRADSAATVGGPGVRLDEGIEACDGPRLGVR